MKLGLDTASLRLALQSGRRALPQVPKKVHKQLRTPQGRRSAAVVLLVVLLVNYLLFGNPLLGPVSKVTKGGYSFANLRDPALVDKVSVGHGFQGRNIIPVKSKEIVPDVDDAQALKQLSLNSLFKVQTVKQGEEQINRYSYGPDFYEDPAESDQADELAITVADFKKMGRKVYKGRDSPEVVLVTGLDFERFDNNYLRKVLPNRIQYAKQRGYGVYARWTQEFTPRLQECNNIGSNWWRPLIMMEAMNAFPHSKWFWFLDEKVVLMRNDIDIAKTLLSPAALDKAMLRGQTVTLPESSIETYRNTDPADVSFIFTQDTYGLCSDSFFVRNDMAGHGIMEYWGDKLFRKYDQFSDNDLKALGHIFRWHPFVLSKAAMVPTRTINSIYTDAKAKADGERSYMKGDLVVNLRSCEFSNTCDSLADGFLKDAKAPDTKAEKEQAKPAEKKEQEQEQEQDQAKPAA